MSLRRQTSHELLLLHTWQGHLTRQVSELFSYSFILEGSSYYWWSFVACASKKIRRKAGAKEIHHRRNSAEPFPAAMVANNINVRWHGSGLFLLDLDLLINDPVSPLGPFRWCSSSCKTHRSQASSEMYKSHSKLSVFRHLLCIHFSGVQWQCFPSSSSAPSLQPLHLPAPCTPLLTLANAWMSKAVCLLMGRPFKCTFSLDVGCASFLSTFKFSASIATGLQLNNGHSIPVKRKFRSRARTSA